MDDKCLKCDRLLTRDEIALNKKLLGLENKRFMCLSCLAKYLNVSEQVLRDKIQQFRNQGCVLF